MRNHSKLIMILFALLWLGGCTTTRYVQAPPIVLPERPAPVVMDDGKHDKSKYPGTKWISKPDVDLNKRKGCWSFKDIETISQALGSWEFWHKDVEELIEGHNQLVDKNEGKSNERPWWRFW